MKRKETEHNEFSDSKRSKKVDLSRVFAETIDNVRPDRVTVDTGKENTPSVCNVVVTIIMDIGQNLSELVYKCMNCKRNVAQFRSLVLRYKNPTNTCLLFDTGRLVNIGTKSVMKALYAHYFLRQVLIENGAKPTFISIEESNYVFTSYIGHSVDLARFYAENQELCTYDPIKYPGCTYKRPEHTLPERVVNSDKIAKLRKKINEKNKSKQGKKDKKKKGRSYMLYDRGTYVIAGAKSETEGVEAHRYTKALLEKYKMPDRPDDIEYLPKLRDEELQAALKKYEKSIVTF